MKPQDFGSDPVWKAISLRYSKAWQQVGIAEDAGNQHGFTPQYVEALYKARARLDELKAELREREELISHKDWGAF